MYNVTNFINHHPGGGDYLMMAAGSSIAPYWNIYKQHDDVEIHKILQKYHIGYVEKESRIPIQKENNSQDPYQNEPKDRNPKLIIKKKEPFNAQPSLIDLRKSYITPTPLWFVRHHHPTPDIKLEEYKLTISGKFIEDSVDFNLLASRFNTLNLASCNFKLTNCPSSWSFESDNSFASSL